MVFLAGLVESCFHKTIKSNKIIVSKINAEIYQSETIIMQKMLEICYKVIKI